MRIKLRFISLEEAIFFHEEEMKHASAPIQIRDLQALKGALIAPKASFGNAFLIDLYDMAATYIESICTHHPFLDFNSNFHYINVSYKLYNEC